MHGQAQRLAYDLVEVVEGGILWVMHNLLFPRQVANTWEVDEPAGPISKCCGGEALLGFTERWPVQDTAAAQAGGELLEAVKCRTPGRVWLQLLLHMFDRRLVHIL